MGVIAVTSTAETYTATISRQVAKAPFVVGAQLLTPVSVAAGTTAEQTFTLSNPYLVAFVSGAVSLVAGGSAFVSKPSFTAGINVVGARISAINTLAVTFQNNTAAAITPMPEVYTIASVSLLGAGSGNAVVSGLAGNTSTANQVYNALTALGAIAIP
jgi:hypothetical protein